MENAEPLKAQLRTELGKGATGRLRRQGMLPGVVYGDGNAAVSVQVEPRELLARIKGNFGLNAIFKLDIDGHDAAPVVRVNEYQRDPVRRELTHVDFEILDADKPITAEVPLVLEGRAAGVASGGVLRQIRRSLKIKTTPKHMPEKLTVDVTDLKIGMMRRVLEVQLPEGVEVIYDVNFSVATVVLPRGVKVAEEDADE